jgi:hypothetical protein
MSSSRTIALRFVCICCFACALSACATQPVMRSFNPPGFFMGLFHGAISPLALIGSIFADTKIYAFPNTGWFYDFGFMLGLCIWAGGGATAAVK